MDKYFFLYEFTAKKKNPFVKDDPWPNTDDNHRQINLFYI